MRREAGIAPHWRKWPILCVAGAGKEIKILDGYSGALLKVVQGHGGVGSIAFFLISQHTADFWACRSLYIPWRSIRVFLMSLQPLQETKLSRCGISACPWLSPTPQWAMGCLKSLISGGKAILRASVFVSSGGMQGMSRLYSP